MDTLALIVVAKSNEELRDFSLEHVTNVTDEIILISNPEARFGGLGKLGNWALDHCRSDIIGLVHADVRLGQGAITAFKKPASDCLTGIVGRSQEGAYVWCCDNPGTVSTLDCCSVFIHKKWGLRFDEATFDGFHCCVEDLCLQASAKGIGAVVPSADAIHKGKMTFNPTWQKQYVRYRIKLQQKWPEKDFQTT